MYTPCTHKNTPANKIINKCIHIISNYLSIQRLSENITFIYRQKINEMYRRVKCYHYMGVWAYNSWIRSNWIHWKSRYIPIRNRGNSDGPEHCLWRTGARASHCLWRTWTSWRKWHAYCTGFKGSAWRTLLYIYRRMLIIYKYSLYVIVLCIFQP